MRILVFLPALTLGGAERQGLFVAHHLKERGHEVEVWGFPPPGNSASLVPELRQHGLPFTELHAWPDWDWRFADGPLSRAYLRGYYYWVQRLRWFAQDMPRRSFDVVIPFTFWPSLAASLLRKQLGARKHYWTQRGGDDDAGVHYNRFLIRQVMARPPRFLANSQAGSRFLQSTFGLGAAEVGVIPNAYVSDDEKSPSDGVPAGRGSDVLTLIHVANFYPEKDYDSVFQALQILTSKGVRVRLHICGAFPQASDRPKFLARLEELEIADAVVYHGPTPRPEVLRLMRTSDIGLLSSRSEGQPNSVMEYMDSGLPVIATNIPGVREIVGPGNQDYLFEPGDAPVLARLILQLGGNPALRLAIGRANRERIATEFAAERVLPRWAELIERE
jgi:glycosyltransferase involved in cell wall biosynthesis